jgi:hypothetical protein
MLRVMPRKLSVRVFEVADAFLMTVCGIIHLEDRFYNDKIPQR